MGVIARLFSQLPVQRVVNSINSRAAAARRAGASPNVESEDKSKTLAAVLDRYLQNKRMIEATACAYDVKSFFVWQPIPSYRYHAKDYRSDPRSEPLRDSARRGYAMLAETIKQRPKESAQNLLWLADIQEQHSELLYVDSLHYTARFCDLIARQIGQFLLDQKLTAPASGRLQASRSH